jgi:hypothetical protein
MTAEPVPPQHLQRVITTAIQGRDYDLHFQRSSPKDRARLLSPGASLWRTTIQTRAEYELLEWEVRCSFRIRHGQQPKPFTQQQLAAPARRQCPLCQHFDLQRDPLHVTNCAHASTNERHRLVVNALVQLVRATGAGASTEPVLSRVQPACPGSGLQPSGERRPDFLLSGLVHPLPLLIDVVVTNPTANSHVSTSQGEGGTANAAEERKRRSYRPIVDTALYDFLAFGIETFGALGNDAIAVLQRIAQQALQSRYATLHGYIAHCRATISFALQRGNARLIARAWDGRSGN